MFEKLSNVIDDMNLLRTELLVLGDFTIDYSSKNLLRTLKVKNVESKYNISQLINTATRITESTATILDWVYVSTEYISTSGTLNHNISDHLPVFVVRKKNRNKNKKKLVEGRSYLRYSTERFQALLNELDWDIYDSKEDNPEILWDIFEKNIIEVLDQICPIKKLTVPENKPKWLNNDLLVLMRKRDAMYREARRKKDPILWRKAKFLQNRVEMSIKRYKKEKIEGELIRNRTNPKKFWANIREIWPKDSLSNVHTLLDDNGDLINTDWELVNHINEYFANIGNKLANEIKNKPSFDNTQLFPHMVLNNNSDDITNRPIEQNEILEIIKEIDINKSSAIENVRAMVIIDAFKAQLDRITRLYNGSLTRCIFPTRWKKGTVVPLPKINIPKTASDMRPISLLHIISKRLKSFLNNTKTLTEKQHGFKKNRSTLSAIVEFLHTIYNNLNTGNDSFIIYLDLKKGFDTVCHKTLLYKLQSIGLDWTTHDWFMSYLTGRSQSVKLNGLCSSPLPVKYGVPQGSILGPTLFSLYINDLMDFVNCDIVFYADDTVIIDKNPVLLSKNLNRIQQWCNRNFLTINCKKSQWMKTKFMGKNNDIIHNFTIDCQNLSQVNEYRYLGLQVDSALTFLPHRDALINNINYKLCFFKKIRQFITLDSATLIYKGTILPIIEYADFVFDYNIQYVNNKMQTLQNQGLYTVHNQHFLTYDLKDSTETLHRKSNILRLQHRRKTHMLSFIYNYRMVISKYVGQ